MHRWHAAGVVVHPVKPDASKTLVAIQGAGIDTEWGWGRIARGEFPPLTPDQVVGMVRSGRADGIAVICGPVSGGIEMVEIEGRARDLLPKLRDHAQQLGVLHLLERLSRGFTEESPSRGLHFLLRVTDGPASSTKLAARPDPTPDEPGKRALVLAETRGAGGITVVFPSSGRTHKSGRPYRLLRGGPETIADFTVAERDALYLAFAALDEMPPEPQPAPRPQRLAAVERRAGDVSPADDFNQRTSWDDLLGSLGWTSCGTRGDRQQWRRPGRTDGISATTIDGVFYAFTTSTNLPSGVGLSRFQVYAHAHHSGDFSAAATELVRLGYGSCGDRRSQQTAGTLEVPQVADAPVRDLEEYRRDLADAIVTAVTTPGLHLVRAPTGAGKSYATAAALRGVAGSLTVLPDHANVRERTQSLVQAGIDAVAYPEPTTDNCGQLDQFRRIQSLGLMPGAVLCPTCPLKDGCKYRAAVKAADRATHRVGTHERLRRSRTAADGVQLVVIDESPEGVIAPTLTVRAQDLVAVASLAHAIGNHWYSTATPEQRLFAAAMLEVVDVVNRACAEITVAGVTSVQLPSVGEIPDNWQRVVFTMVGKAGGPQLVADAVQMVTRAAAGDLHDVQVVTDVTERTTGTEDGGKAVDRRLHHWVVARWRPAIAEDASVILLDGTADADNVAAVAGRHVTDRTPTGFLPAVHPVVQVTADITRGASSRTVAGIVDAFLAENPGVGRLGIIGHQHHVRDLVGTEDAPGILGHHLGRVAMSTWFGAGPDRASNRWHSDCDHVLILGTPRVNPGDYRRWLVQHGLDDAAGLEDGGWAPRPWAGTSVTGDQVPVQRSGYSDPSWDRAYRAITVAGLLQAIGRGRSTLADGVPVTVVSNEPTGHPVRPLIAPTPAAVREVVDVVQDLLGHHPGSAETAIGSPYSGSCASRVRSADVVAALRDRHGIQDRAAHLRVADAVDAGRLVRFGRGWLGMPAEGAAPPAALPAITPPAPSVVAVAAPGIAAATVATTQDAATQDVVDLVDERAAIAEFDGGLPSGEAAQRALLEVLNVPPPDTQEPAPQVLVAGADHVAVAVRSAPFVATVLERFPGVVRRVIQPAASRGALPAAAPGDPTRCSCGHTATREVLIHGGRSTRHDCAHCDRFRRFGDWYSRPVSDPDRQRPPSLPPLTTPDWVAPPVVAAA